MGSTARASSSKWFTVRASPGERDALGMSGQPVIYFIGMCFTARASPCEGAGSAGHSAGFLFVRIMVRGCSTCHSTLAGYSSASADDLKKYSRPTSSWS